MKRLVKHFFPRKKFPKEKKCQYLVIPDLHGAAAIFQKVQHYIKTSCERDRVIIFLGDYMDRGDEGEVFGREFLDAGSFHLLKALFSLKSWARQEARTIHFLRGNHEIFFEDYFLKEKTKAYDKFPFFRESVDALEYAFSHDYTLYPQFEAFLNALLPYYFDKENGYLFIHAGIDNSVGSLKEQADNGLIYWIRDKFIYDTTPLPYTVVFGHTPFKEPYFGQNKIGLDSGIYESGYINLLKIDDDETKIIKIKQ